MRSPSQVFHDHPTLRAEARLEDDLERNYSTEVVLIHQFGVKRGRQGVRESAHALLRLRPARRPYVWPHARVR
jgi:hypothetical protein